jgi:gliding motility-associated-like protein
MQITSDGSVSCQDGFGIIQMSYEVGCSLGGAIYDIEWSPGTALSSTTIAQPTVTGLTNTTTYDLTIHPPGFPECATTDQVTVFVGEEVEAGESTSEEFCGSYGNIPLFGLLGGNPDPGGVWTDENGEEVSGLFDTLSDEPGVFTYTVSDAGCEEFATVEIAINEVIIEASADTTVCINGTATLSAQAISGNVNDPITYIWNFGEFVGDTYSFDPVSNPTPVVVYGTFDQNCITNTEEILVFIRPPLQMNLMDDVVVCLEDSIELIATSISGGLEPYTFSWIGDNGDNLDGNPVMVQLFEETEYCLTLSDACETDPITDCVTVELEELVLADFLADIQSGCNPITVNFQGFATNPEIISSVIWDFGDGTFANTVNQASHTYFEPGIYDVTLTITSDAGCVYDETAENYIASNPLPVAAFSSDPLTALLPNTTFEFENQSLGALYSNWTFGPYGFSEETSPEFTFPVEDAQVIEVELIVENMFGCFDTISRNVFINEDFVIYVPNAFTPDNDGLNDFFFVHGEDVNLNEYELQIYNRWGQLIWETNDIFQPWDGSVNNGGYYSQEEVYIWKIETRSLSTSDKIELKGFVTILR